MHKSGGMGLAGLRNRRKPAVALEAGVRDYNRNCLETVETPGNCQNDARMEARDTCLTNGRETVVYLEETIKRPFICLIYMSENQSRKSE